METKICIKCELKKDLIEFYNLKRSKDGLMSHCKLCDKNKTSIWAKNNKDKHNAKSRRWNKNNKEKLAIRNSRPECVIARSLCTANWQKRNKEYVNLTVKNWRRKNPDKQAYISATNRASRLKRTPKWLTKDQKKEISIFYKKSRELTKNTGIKYQVDHIIPLQGKIVSGLHVPWNLQILSAKENNSKKNKLLIDNGHKEI